MNRLRPEHYELARQRLAQNRRQGQVLGGYRRDEARRRPEQMQPGVGGEVWNKAPDNYYKVGNP